MGRQTEPPYIRVFTKSGYVALFQLNTIYDVLTDSMGICVRVGPELTPVFIPGKIEQFCSDDLARYGVVVVETDNIAVYLELAATTIVGKTC